MAAGPGQEHEPVPGPALFSAPTLPPIGPAPAPAHCTSAQYLTPPWLYNFGYRGYRVSGIECILPPICPVPGGVFTIGSDKRHDPLAADNEVPQYPIDVAPFAIGEHLVTVAEYACALRENAVREPSPDPASHLDWASQLSAPTHPVACVSWSDAFAYAQWLARTTNQHWRLPTEAEWEKAARGTDARGTDARSFPWGNTFAPERCNTDRRAAGTTPVAQFPGGASPYHAQGRAGNVWEWTNSQFRAYPYRRDDGREEHDPARGMVRRGGSWSWDSLPRVAERAASEASDAHDSNGFRLAGASLLRVLTSR